MKTLKISIALMCLATGFFGALNANAANINAASCSSSNVTTAINSASNGDTVVVPAGSCSWSSGVTINGKSITVQGAGIGATILNASVTAFNLSGLQSARVTGFTINASGGNGININGGEGWRIDHNRIASSSARTLMVDAVSGSGTNYIPYGVFDHNQFVGTWVTTFGRGQPEWFEPTNLGSNKATYIEDNTFTGPSDGSEWLVSDANYGGRVVFRYNQVTITANSPTSYSGNFQWHSLQGGDQLLRGARKFEMYGNVFESLRSTGSAVAAYLRSGTGVAFQNSFINYNGGNSALLLDNVRSYEPRAPYGQCDGTATGNIDGNTSSTTTYRGWPCRDQIGRGQDASLFKFNTTPYPSQASEPLYQWENYHYTSRSNFNLGKSSGTKVNYAVSSDGNNKTHIVANRDFYNDTVKPSYTPFTYPHPLTNNVLTPPPTSTLLAPQNLRLTQ